MGKSNTHSKIIEIIRKSKSKSKKILFIVGPL